MTATEYGLRDLKATWQTRGVLSLITEVICEVRRRNTDRQEPQLGDDALSQGMLNWRNIGNRLEKRAAEVPGLLAARPQNSFQLVVDGHVISVYGLSSADPESMRWIGSGMKISLARTNSCLVGDGDLQYSLFDQVSNDSASEGDDVLQPANITFAHWASPDGESVRIWMGFPRDNTGGGSPWLEVVELSLSKPAPRPSQRTDTDSGPATYLDASMPDVDLTWRDDDAQAPSAPAAQ